MSLRGENNKDNLIGLNKTAKTVFKREKKKKEREKVKKVKLQESQLLLGKKES